MKAQHNKILITGGTAGIGLAMAQLFLAHHNTVIVVGRRQERLNLVCEQNPGLLGKACDVSIPAEREELQRWVQEHHPDLNLLINNAAVQYNFSMLTDGVTGNDISQEVQTNLVAPVELCRLLLPILQQQRESAIVNVTTGLVFSPKKSAPVYCATKSALHTFSQALRYQLEGTSVKVFELLPPLVETQMTEGRGTGKIAPEQCAEALLRGLKRNQYEIPVGKVHLLRWLWRLFPVWAGRLLRNT